MTALLLLAAFSCALLSGLTGALGYALRDFSRARLEAVLEKRGKAHRLAPLLEHTHDFTLIIASIRVLSIILLLGSLLLLTEHWDVPNWGKYLFAFILSSALSTFFSVGVASSLARWFGEDLIARLDPFLHGLRAVFSPLLWPLHTVDSAIFHISPHSKGDPTEQAEQQVEDEILAVVEEGEKEGVVDETDREMIESVIEFRDTTASQIMTARPDIVAIPLSASLDDLITSIESSGHSRLPVYDKDLDHIIGVLYARDLLLHLSDLTKRGAFDLRKHLRPVNFVPESKPLKDLLREFKLRKVHLAIVLDEYGGTAGLVTIEDILEELVGDISDEHEPFEPPALHKLNDDTWEAQASTYIDEVNSIIGLSLPEDDGYDTLAGYISHTLGRIPEPGEEFTTPTAKWKVLEAEPTKVTRVRLTLTPAPQEDSPLPPQEETPAEAERA